MNARGFARRLRDADECLYGTWVKLATIETVEMLAAAGFDFIVIDMEHAPLDLETAYRATVVAQGLGVHTLVRLPDRSESHVQRLLDVGIDGLLIPRVEGIDQVREVMAQTSFSPGGRRGLGTTSRAGFWGGVARADYLRHGDENVMRAVQIEDIDTLRIAEQVLEVPNLNGLFIGMGDLSLSSGRGGDDPEVCSAVDRALTRAAELGIPCGTAVQTAEQAHAAAERGYRFVMVNNDASIFREATARIGRDLRTAAQA